MTKPTRRQIGLLTLGLLVLAGIVWGFWPRPFLVETAEVGRGILQVTVEEEGKTRVIDRYIVSALVAGFAQRVELDVGDPVEQGQVLLELEPLRAQVLDPRSRAEAEARVAATRSALGLAEEEVEAADSEADVAKRDYERRVTLYEQGPVSREELDKARSVMRRTEARLRSARFAVEVAKYEHEAALTALEYSAARTIGEPAETVAIRAPVSGSVLKVFHESEGVVNAGEHLIELGNPSALEVEVDVLSNDAVRIAPGTRVLFERWGGQTALEGIVRVVEPTGFTKISALGVEEQRVLVIADITSPSDHWQRLGDGYRVEARFIVWEGGDVLRIPSSALFRFDEGWAVFVSEGGRARRRPVEIGRHGGLVAEIIAGLEVGDTVITYPSDAIDDGTRVEPR